MHFFSRFRRRTSVSRWTGDIGDNRRNHAACLGKDGQPQKKLSSGSRASSGVDWRTSHAVIFFALHRGWSKLHAWSRSLMELPHLLATKLEWRAGTTCWSWQRQRIHEAAVLGLSVAIVSMRPSTNSSSSIALAPSVSRGRRAVRRALATQRMSYSQVHRWSGKSSRGWSFPSTFRLG